MPIHEYRGLSIAMSENDSEYKGYFDAARLHRLVVKKCQDCGLLRGEPGPGCPWCTSLNWEWQEVSGKGTIYSYQIVAHTVMPAFRDWAPFAIVLVELDEQRGTPDQYDGLRITANLLDVDMNPEKEENVAIGSRVEVMFLDVDEEFALPQFKLSGEPPESQVWSHMA